LTRDVMKVYSLAFELYVELPKLLTCRDLTSGQMRVVRLSIYTLRELLEVLCEIAKRGV